MRKSRLVIQNIQRNRQSFLFCVFGIMLGVGMFSFFIALGGGIQDEILNRIYPINQLEMEPRSVAFLGVRDTIGFEGISKELLTEIQNIPGVFDVFPKLKSHFRARLFGGKKIFGDTLRTEAFMDGIEGGLIQAEWGGERAEAFQDHGEFLSCTGDEECNPEGGCRQGQCWDRVCDGEKRLCGGGELCVPVHCSSDIECGGTDGSCREGMCLTGFCASRCEIGESSAQLNCRLGFFCVELVCSNEKVCPDEGTCEDGVCRSGYCEAIPCELARRKAQYSLEDEARGEIDLPCEGTDCPEVQRCPEGTFCIPESVEDTEGRCEVPLPVALSPFLVDLFNVTAVPAFGLEPLEDEKALVGLIFQVQYGNSYMGTDEHTTRQVTKKAKVVGFSDKAMVLGLTVPVEYLRRANHRYQGRGTALEYDALIIRTSGNEDVQDVLLRAEALGLQVTPKTREAKSAANLLALLTFGFALVSWLILGVAAINVSQTFHMTVSRRERELGILRSLGANARDLRFLVLTEALLVGGGGSILGMLLAGSAAWIVNTAAHRLLAGMTFLPDTFFTFSWTAVVISLALGLGFSIVGALGPSSRAARLDPAIVTR
jgi:hypothetical protein